MGGVSFQAETWIWFAICTLSVIARLASRRLLLRSWRNLQVDDGLMLFAIIPYTAMIYALNEVDLLGSNVIPPENVPYINPADVPNFMLGSKWAIVADVCANTTTWIVKVCMLILFARVTTHVRKNIVVRLIGAYIVLGYIVMEILFFAYWCRPFHNFWIIPAPQAQCATYLHHIILNAALNISSDIMLLALILPVIVKLQLPLKRKVILYCVFSLGIFTIVATVLNRAYNIIDPYGSGWVVWYIREPSTAVLVSNLPLMWPLIQRIRNVGPFVMKSVSARSNTNVSRSRSRYGYGTDTTSSKNQMHIIERADSNDDTSSEEAIADRPLQIWQEIEITVQDEVAVEPKALEGAPQKFFEHV